VNAKAITAKLFEIIEPVAADAGYELVDLAFVREGHGWVVRVFIDHQRGDDVGYAPDNASVSFSDCEEMSRELSASLDVEDPVPCAFTLEVSSPGLDRPLRTSAHFARYLGQVAKIRLHTGTDGRRNFKGTLVAANGDRFTIDVDGREFVLDVANVATARLVPDWDAIMGQSRE
jgi:ribosome maturation factor RimP